MTEHQWNELKVGDIIRNPDIPWHTWVLFAKDDANGTWHCIKGNTGHLHVYHINPEEKDKWLLVSTIIERRRWDMFD